MAIASASSRYPAGAGAAIGSGGSYSGTFIPEIWSGKLLEKFYDATIFGAICNTDYEGEIKNQGDTIKIRQRPDITIRTYEPDGELTLERPNAAVTEFTIDYAKYFAVVLDDIYEVQADMDMMSMWAQDASEAMKINIDTAVLATNVLGACAAANRGATAGRKSADINLGVTTAPLPIVARDPGAGEKEVIDLIVDMGLVLDEQNIPESGRWLVLPPWLGAKIKKSELRDASVSGDGMSMLRNGRIGSIDRFTLYMSNLLPAGTAGGLAAGETAIFAGHNLATCFASQLTKVETVRSERTFGDVMRGLQVYGVKVLNPVGLAQAIVTKA
jgi:hypothetical protein